jgi:hypothetical protein
MKTVAGKRHCRGQTVPSLAPGHPVIRPAPGKSSYSIFSLPFMPRSAWSPTEQKIS